MFNSTKPGRWLWLAVTVGVALCLNTTGSHAQLRVTSHASSIDGQLANSHLIAGRTEGLLVDAQLTRSDAQQVVAMIKRSQIKRLTVFITHGHADHYLGLAEITAAFPRARVFSNATTATEIARKGNDALMLWKRSLGDDVAESIVIPEVVRGPRLELEGEAIRVIDFNDAESTLASGLYFADRGWLFSGDMVFSGVHLRLAENRPEKWRRALDDLDSLNLINRIYPGHGDAGPSGLIERNRTYLTRFMELTRKSETADQLVEAMDELYPAYFMPHFLRHAAETVMGDAGR